MLLSARLTSHTFHLLLLTRHLLLLTRHVFLLPLHLAGLVAHLARGIGVMVKMFWVRRCDRSDGRARCDWCDGRGRCRGRTRRCWMPKGGEGRKVWGYRWGCKVGRRHGRWHWKAWMTFNAARENHVRTVSPLRINQVYGRSTTACVRVTLFSAFALALNFRHGWDRKVWMTGHATGKDVVGAVPPVWEEQVNGLAARTSVRVVLFFSLFSSVLIAV
ncbi:hypothetical protein BC829DRAFT_378915 [Chytridium lagenaria]|nr:hypothetical protein BC829DRAFT_378915 [Chytridium lagenaria]